MVIHERTHRQLSTNENLGLLLKLHKYTYGQVKTFTHFLTYQFALVLTDPKSWVGSAGFVVNQSVSMKALARRRLHFLTPCFTTVLFYAYVLSETIS